MMMLTWRTWYRWDDQIWVDNDDKDDNNEEAMAMMMVMVMMTSPDTEKYLKVHIDEADEGKNSSS